MRDDAATIKALRKEMGGVGEMATYEYYGCGTVHLGVMSKSRALRIYRLLRRLQKKDKNHEKRHAGIA